MGKMVKNVFKKVKNNIWTRWCLRLAALSLYRNHPTGLLCKSIEWFLCNSNTGLKWQRECMVKVTMNLYIFLIVSSWKRNVKLQSGRRLNPAFQTGMMKTRCYLAPKETLIYNELIWNFIQSDKWVTYWWW